MKHWFRFGLTQRFLLFFIFSGIFPVALMGIFLIRDVHLRLENRLNSLLETGEQLALSIIQSDLEQLTLTAQHAIVLSLREKYALYLANGEKSQLDKVTHQLFDDKQLEFIALFDQNQEIVSCYGIDKQQQALATLAFKNYLKDNTPHFGTEDFSPSLKNQHRLYYVASAPIVFDNGKQGGTLLIAQYISKHFSFQKLNQIVPLLKIRITQPSREKLIFQNMLTTRAVHSGKSFSVPLLNSDNKPIGTVVVSTPVENEQKLYRDELLMTFLYLMTGIALLAWLGLWLNQSIVTPLQGLTNASIAVAKGDFKVRVSDKKTGREVRQTLQNFNKMIYQLGENHNIRNTFIASLTHDLRTPLLAEKRVLELFLEFKDELPGNFVQLAQGLLQSNHHLIEMVNQMLEAYQLESGKINLAYTPITLSPLVQECFEKLAPLAQMQNITLNNAVPENMGEFQADRQLLKRVLINLVGNAIDNLETGNSVWVKAAEQPEHVLVMVKDNGPGIPEESLPNLFERYTTGQVNRQKIASGLGLFICRIIMESHGGMIFVDSKIDEGTTFTLVFPKALPQVPNIPN